MKNIQDYLTIIGLAMVFIFFLTVSISEIRREIKIRKKWRYYYESKNTDIKILPFSLSHNDLKIEE